MVLGLIPLAVAAMALWRRRLGTVFTCATVLCLVTALARPQWSTAVYRVARLYALDTSGSVFLDTPRALDTVRRSMGDLRRGDVVGFLAFAASTLVVVPPTPRALLPPRLSLPASLPRHDATDIAAAIRAASQQLADPAFDSQIVLLTDGQATSGDAPLEAALAAERRARVFAVPLGPSNVRDARLSLLRVPTRVRVGEPFSIEVEAVATAPLEATLALSRQGAPMGPPRRITLEPGVPRRTVVQDRLDAPGTCIYTARLAVVDRCDENNAAEGIVRAEGAVRVLHLAPANNAVARLLAATPGLDLAPVAPERLDQLPVLLTGADCLVLDGVGADQVPAPIQDALRDWVRDTGAGLVALGGPSSFGPGGYTGTAIEQALPVLSSPPQRIALLVALDASGSMADAVAGRQKIAYAREAALRCLGRLGDSDLFGLLAFSHEPAVIVPLGPPPRADALARLLDGVRPHGPTELRAALERSLALLARVPAQVRHVILASDGEVTDDQAAGIRTSELKGRLAAAGVTLSALMTGHDEKAAALLRELAGASFQLIENPADLPSAFLDELRKAATGPLIRKGAFPVRAAAALEIASGVPPGILAGYLRTVAKPAAAVEWAAADPPDPVLARWQFGLGRAVAFTSTVGTDWDAPLWGAAGPAPMLQQAVRWAARPARSPGFEADLAERGEQMVLTVRAEREGRFLNGLDLVARISGPAIPARDLSLPQTAPGEYQAAFDAPLQGVYRAAIIEKGAGHRLTIDAARNYAREWETFGPNHASLEAIARAGRGELLPSLDALRTIAPREALGRLEIDWLFLAAALVLFVADVAFYVARSRRERL
ncbi:MAG TPA: vWA domain-containing protein [Planctomycetota bacterium]|nr:vWA domain-containing protein [Planctomycetota bacterium]